MAEDILEWRAAVIATAMLERFARSKDGLALVVAQGRNGCPVAVVVPISN